MFHQTFQPRDLLLVLTLVVLEGMLSIDNALVLGLLARRLPERLQTKALTYGLVGSFLFRLMAIGLAAFLLKWRIVKLIGGGYLVYIAMKHFFFHPKKKKVDEPPGHTLDFWKVVASIELTDVAFAADSILAGIALVGPLPRNSPSQIHPKLWVILLGGMAGVLLMRIAAVGFIHLIKKFPGMESTAYLLVTVVGLKLIADWWFNAAVDRLNFESPSSPAFWVFWMLMLLCVASGFFRRSKAIQFQA